MCTSGGNGGFNFNPLGVITTADGKWRKPKDFLNTALNPARLGGVFDSKTQPKADMEQKYITVSDGTPSVSNVQANDPLVKKKTAQVKSALLESDNEDTGTLLY
jgi:hypothetical protein